MLTLRGRGNEVGFVSTILASSRILTMSKGSEACIGPLNSFFIVQQRNIIGWPRIREAYVLYIIYLNHLGNL